MGIYTAVLLAFRIFTIHLKIQTRISHIENINDIDLMCVHVKRMI